MKFFCTGLLSFLCFIPFNRFACAHSAFFCCCFFTTYSTFCSVWPKLRFHWSEVGKKQSAAEQEWTDENWWKGEREFVLKDNEMISVIHLLRASYTRKTIWMHEMSAKICIHELYHTKYIDTHTHIYTNRSVHKRLREWNRFTPVQIIIRVIFNYCLVCH